MLYRHPLDRGIPPSWAVGWGEDPFGVFVEVSTDIDDLHSPSVRFYWSPGRLLWEAPADAGDFEQLQTEVGHIFLGSSEDCDYLCIECRPSDYDGENFNAVFGRALTGKGERHHEG